MTLSASFEGVSIGNYKAQAAWFKYGTSQSNLNKTVYSDDLPYTTDGQFTAEALSLSPETKYYFKAYMSVWSEEQGKYVDIESPIGSFTTAKQTKMAYQNGWLELPALRGDEDYFGYFYGSSGTSDDDRNYSYNYSYHRFASLWTAYQLKYEHKSGSASTSSWYYNPNIDEKYQVNMTGNSYPTMYGASNYSKGHQCPSADRKSNDLMNKQTYYCTNQTPQIQTGFNQGIWSSLEDAERSLVTRAGEVVYVVTGPVYSKEGENEEITYFDAVSGKDAYPAKVPRPNYYWKAFLKVKWKGSTVESASAIGFWFEHKTYSNDNYSNYTVSVNQIEEWTGFDLFANLPDSIEGTAESNTNWGTFSNF